MLPPKYGIKRRRSRSKNGEPSNLQSSLAAGGLRKRTRLGRSSKVLRGGVYCSKFGWPYNPPLSDEQILDWIRKMRQPLIDCFRTRQGTNRDGILTDEQVAMTDRSIERKIGKLNHFKKNNDVGTYDMLDELMNLLKFTNLFVVTNKTPNTSVKLNRKPLVDTTLKYDCPLILRLEDAFSSDPVHIRDWRPGSGGAEENPGSEIFLQADFFKWESVGDSLIVTVTLEDKRVFMFKVKWFGPHAVLLKNDPKKMPTWISYIKNWDGSEVPDSLLVPNPSTMRELIERWMPYMWYLVKTKTHGIYVNLCCMYVGRAFEDTIADFCLFQDFVKKPASEVSTEMLTKFRHTVNRLRVVNLTEGSMVLLRTTHSSFAFRYLQPEYVDLYPVDIIAAEVHFPEVEEVRQITKEMVTVENVANCVEVIIDLGGDDFVALKLDWLGPTEKAKDGQRWENYLELDQKSRLMRSDVDRVGKHYGRIKKARAVEKYQQIRPPGWRVKSPPEFRWRPPTKAPGGRL